MTKSDVPSKINAVEVGELSYIQIGSPTPVLSVEYAFANAETGDRFGRGSRNRSWSQKTLDALHSLLECVEQDLVADVFGETTTGSVVPSPRGTSGGVPSL